MKKVLYVKQAIPIPVSVLKVFLMQQPVNKAEAAMRMLPTGFRLMIGWLHQLSTWPFWQMVETWRQQP